MNNQSSPLPKNPNAVALGKLGRGKAKTLTLSERKRRRKSLEEARKVRWQGKKRGASATGSANETQQV